MQGVILTAGKGSRLHPLTLIRSKAMLPILGKPIVERVMADLIVNGINDFILVVSPTDSVIVDYFEHRKSDEITIKFVYQDEQMGMGDALKRAAPFIKDDFLLSACDNLISAEHVSRMIAAWRQSGIDGLLTLMPVGAEAASRSAIVEADGSWIKRIIEKPGPEEAPSLIASLPLYCFSPRLLFYVEKIPRSQRGEYELQDAIQALIDDGGRVKGVQVNTRLTLTTITDLLTINRHFLRNHPRYRQFLPRFVGDGTKFIEPVFIERDVWIGENCIIGPDVYIEQQCRVGNGVTARNAVLLRDARVGDGSVITGQVMW